MKLFASFKDKRFRYGTFSTVMILIAVAVFIFVNLVAGQLNITKDLTDNKMFSLSSYTEEFAAELDSDVNIYALMVAGQENVLLSQLLDEYAALSPRIHVEYRDPNLNPAFAEQYSVDGAAVTTNSVIVESDLRFKVIPPGDMITYETDYYSGSQTVTGLEFESQISKAIHYVSQEDTPLIYHVNGNSEYELPASLIKELEDGGYGFGTVDPVLGEIPEDCDALLITTPGRDWTSDEASKILTYLQGGGRAMFLLSPAQERFTNMDNVLAAYGVRYGEYIVLEGDADHYTLNSPQYVLPDFTDHEAVSALKNENFRSLVIQATGIEELDVKKVSTTIEPILVTSDAAYGRIDPNITTVNKDGSDVDGPFNLGVAITDNFMSGDSTLTAKLIVLGCEALAAESFNEAVGGTNFGVIVSGFNWLYEQPASLYIPSKSPSQVSTLNLTQTDANIMMLVSLIVLPLGFTAAGIVVWYRRRHS